MKESVIKVLKTVGAAIWLVLIAPFILAGFLVVKLIGGDPFSMDDMGASWMTMIAVAIGLAVAAGAFTIGYLL